MPDAFDPYHKWLGIPAHEQPPNHYRLLGITRFETDCDVIANAADQRMAHIRTFQMGQTAQASQRLLNEISMARVCLLSPERKALYDAQLQQLLLRASAVRPELPPPVVAPPVVQAALDPGDAAGPVEGIDLGLDFSDSATIRRPRPRGLSGFAMATIGGVVLLGGAVAAYLVMNFLPEPAKLAQREISPPSKTPAQGIVATTRKPPLPFPAGALNAPRSGNQLSRRPAANRSQERVSPEDAGRDMLGKSDPVKLTPEQLAQESAAAKTPEQFQRVAQRADDAAEQALSAGSPATARDLVLLALSAARKSGNNGLIRKVTLRRLQIEKGSAGPAANTQESGNVPEPANIPARKLPVPDEAAQAQAAKLIQELFKEKYAAATTTEQRQALAHELLAKAKNMPDDPAGQYLLLHDAGNLAVKAADVEIALDAIRQVQAAFEVDTLAMKAGVLAAIGKVAAGKPQCKALAESAAAVIDQALAGDQYELAGQLAATAVSAARKTQDGALLRRAMARKKELDELEKAHEQALPALAALEARPADPQANLAAGRFFCLCKGDWERGIPLLALGGDGPLPELAGKELQEAAAAEEQLGLGDGWWDLGESDKTAARKRLQGHAASWYRQALPGLSGLLKEKAQKRLDEWDAAEKAAAKSAEQKTVPRNRKARLAEMQAKMQTLLVGDFRLTWSKPLHSGTERWTFRADNTAAVEGVPMATWRIVDDKIIVQYQQPGQGAGIVQFTDPNTLVGQRQLPLGLVFQWVFRRIGAP